jgi:hypothetical protein
VLILLTGVCGKFGDKEAAPGLLTETTQVDRAGWHKILDKRVAALEKQVHYLSTLTKDKDVVSESTFYEDAIPQLPKVNGPLPKVNGPLAELIKVNEEKWQKSNAQSQEIYEAVAQGLPNAGKLRSVVAGYIKDFSVKTEGEATFYTLVLQPHPYHLPVPHIVGPAKLVRSFDTDIRKNDLIADGSKIAAAVVVVKPHSRYEHSKLTDCGWRCSEQPFVSDFSQAKWPGKRVAPMFSPEGWSFQHFIDGALPKLMIGLLTGTITKNTLILLDGSSGRPRDKIILELLGAMGLKTEQVKWDQLKSTTFVADEMLNLCRVQPLQPALWKAFRYLVGVRPASEGATKSKKLRVVYMPRVGTRSIQNKDMFWAMLQKLDPGAINFKDSCGEYNLDNAKRVFAGIAETVVVVGMHGGQLYNALFAPEGSHIIEFNSIPSQGGAPLIFWMVAEMWGMHYTRYMLKDSKELEVPVQEFEAWFRSGFGKAGYTF